MSCFGMDWLFHFLILLVVICVAVGVLLIVIPWALSFLGVGVSEPAMRIIRLIITGIVLIFIIYMLWALWDCFAGSSSLLLPRRG
jgi:hypothetical protein